MVLENIELDKEYILEKAGDDARVEQYRSMNLWRVDCPPLRMWFSYDTLVGYGVYDDCKVSENCYSRTTGRHINIAAEDLGCIREPRTDVENFKESFKLAWSRWFKEEL